MEPSNPSSSSFDDETTRHSERHLASNSSENPCKTTRNENVSEDRNEFFSTSPRVVISEANRSARSNSPTPSEISVACLQDRIMQMEESHHCTNEELQATLQELTDLQEQVNMLQIENSQLEQDKAVLYESLCSQTEKLEECRAQIMKLRQLVIDQYSGPTSSSSSSGNILQLHSTSTSDSLATSSQPHKVSITVGGAEDIKDRPDSVSSIHRFHISHPYECLSEPNISDIRAKLKAAEDKIVLLESSLDSVTSERDEISAQLTDLDKKLSSTRLENASFKCQLDKLNSNDTCDSETTPSKDNFSHLESVERVCMELKREKQFLEMKMNQLEQANRHLQTEMNSFKDEILGSRDQLVYLRNNAKKTKEDCDHRISALEDEKVELLNRISILEETSRQSDVMCQRHTDERRDLSATINDLQLKLSSLSEELSCAHHQLDACKRERLSEQEEWKSFQSDLLTTVRVANEFKMDALEHSEKVTSRNRLLEEKVSRLEAEMAKLKSNSDKNSTLESCSFTSALQNQSTPTLQSIGSTPTSTPTSSPLKNSSANGNAVPLQCMRNGDYFSTPTGRPSIARWVDSRACTQMSVKTLIDSIENTSPVVTPLSKSPNPVDMHNILPNMLSAGSTPFRPYSSIQSNQYSLGQASGSSSSPGHDPSNVYRKADSLLSKTATRSFSCPANQAGNGRVPVAEVAPSCSSFTKSQPSGSMGMPTNDNLHSPVSAPVYGVPFIGHKMDSLRRNSVGDLSEKKDPLVNLVKTGGSKRNALLKWCQKKTIGYRLIDITNFSSSWNDGLAFCALLHTYMPAKVPYETLDGRDKRTNFSLAFKAAESCGISTTLNIEELVAQERPDWHQIMAYVISIYRHFES